MNKLFTKIAAFSVGLAMAIGVGVAVGSGNKEAKPVEAYSSTTKYQLITSTSDLVAGANYIMGATYNGSNYFVARTSNNNNRKLQTADIVSNKVTLGNVIMPLTLGGSTGAWTFHTNDYGGTAGYFNATNTTGNNYLKIVANLDNYAYFSISIASGGDATITCTGKTSRNIIYLYQSSQISCYTSTTSTNYRLPRLYKEVSESTPLTGIAITGSGVTQTSTGHYAYNIASSSDTAQKSVTVDLTPDSPTDKAVNVAHSEGTSGLLTFDSSVSCTASGGTGTFHFNGKGTGGSETLVISGHTETSVKAYLTVTIGTYYTVTFNSDGGTPAPASQSVESGQTFKFPSPGTKTNYSFLGWSSNGGTDKYQEGDDSPTVTGAITYTAYWQENAKVTVTYSAGTHGTGSYAHTNQYVGTYTLLAFANLSGITVDSGYRFKNYTVGGVNKNPGDTFTLSAATTVTVNFEEQPPEDVLTSSVIPAAAVGSSTSSWGTASTFSDSTGAVYTGRFMGVSSSSFIGRLNDSANGYIYTSTVPSNMKLKSVSISSMTASKTVGVYAQSGAYTACVTDKTTALGTITPDSLTYTFDSNTSYNAICLRGHTSATEIGTVTITYEALAVLDSVTTSGQTASFIAGNKWSYGGTLTAHYTAGKADATVTPTSFKYGASGINPTTAGTAITTSTTLDHDTHNGKYIYVVYTEDDITKWASYQITVNYAAVTSVVINTHAAEIGLNETYDYTLVGVTVNTSYADPGYEWVVSGNTVSDDYTFDGSGLKSKDTEGTITLRCQSTADNSKYDELVVTVTGDPTAEFTPASVSGYVGKSDDIAFTYGNMSDTSLISITSSNSSIAEVDEFVADAGEGLVTVNFVAAGSATLSISYDGGSALDTVGVTVSADSVTALTWSAPTIKVYSGATTTVSDASSWNVHYTMASGDEGDLSYGEYTLKLGGSSITLPHTWDASEDGKVLSIEYGGFSSPTTSTVNVTQTLRAVMADVPGEETTKTWNASSGALGSSMGSTTGVTDSGSLTFDDESTMSYTRTLEYLASGKSDYVAWSSPYIQFGSSNALETLELSVTNSNVVTQVQIYCWAKNGATDVTVKVGGNVFDESKAAPSAAGSLTFSGSASGNIVITMEKASKNAGCAQYIASVAITTVESSGEQVNIANVAGHEAAQKAVVAFAKAMNAAFDNTKNCTEGVAAAWSTASSAYASNITNNASLSAQEKAYANNLIKYASAQYTDDTDEDFSYCLERAMKTYETCIQKHGQTGFIDVRPVENAATPTNPLAKALGDSAATTTAIVVVSIVSAAAVGGYFFIRRRKVQ